MICCIAALFVHFGAIATVPPRTVPASGSQAASLPDVPAANTDCVSPASPPQPANPVRLIPAESAPSRLPWLILSVAQHGAAAFDAYSTRRAITRGAIEADPLMRPFAHSPEIYVATQIGPAVLDIVARHMQRSRNNFWRRTWWVPQSASTAIFLFSGIHNLQFATKP